MTWLIWGAMMAGLGLQVVGTADSRPGSPPVRRLMAVGLVLLCLAFAAGLVTAAAQGDTTDVLRWGSVLLVAVLLAVVERRARRRAGAAAQP